MMIPRELAADELSDFEKQLREKFVTEYMRDFNEVNACVRMGYHISYAVEFGQRYMSEPYVLNLIADRKAKSDEAPDSEKERDRVLIMQTLRRACQTGQTATQVQAAKILANLHGLDAIEDDGGEVRLIGVFKEFAAKVKGLDNQDG